MQKAAKVQATKELRELKSSGLGRFDELKLEFEGENQSQLEGRGLTMWHLECEEWRKIYYQQIADIEAKLKAKMAAWLFPLSEVKQAGLKRPSTKQYNRAVTKSNFRRNLELPGRPSTQASNQFRTTSISGFSRESDRPSPTPGIRGLIKNSRARVSVATPRNELADPLKSPTKALQSPTRISVTSSLNLERGLGSILNSAQPEGLESESSTLKSQVPEEREDDSFLPCPNEKKAYISEGSVEPLKYPGRNVMFSGLNKLGSCGFKKSSKVVFKMLSFEFSLVECGHFHTAVIDAAGVLYTFGKGSNGQLGTGMLDDYFEPVLVTHPLEGVPVAQVSCGWQHTLCVTKQGQVFAWGFNSDGQLGLGDCYDRSQPCHVPFQDQIIQVSAGYLHSAAVSTTNILFTWGANPDGRLFRAPVKVKHNVYQKDIDPQRTIDLNDVQKVALSNTHSIAMNIYGEVYTSGSPDHGQLGIGTTYDTSVPLAKLSIFTDNQQAIDVGCGDHFCVVLTKAGEVFSFGKGSFGRLGHGHESDVLVPQKIKTTHKIVKLACGGRHVACINAEGELVVWGYGFYNQLCTEEDFDFLEPTVIDLTGKTGYWPKHVACGYFSTAIVTL
mmetsp:Transcript_8999/g.17374  ORF Transcript_8999/g.17374 Transcript_8999/m.17374 type:complete len:613 (-) Transcript_8999:27-1865(-)